MTNATLQSRLDVYLELRRSLGYKTSVQEHALQDFLDYLQPTASRSRFAPRPSWTGPAKPQNDATGPAPPFVFAWSAAFSFT